MVGNLMAFLVRASGASNGGCRPREPSSNLAFGRDCRKARQPLNFTLGIHVYAIWKRKFRTLSSVNKSLLRVLLRLECQTLINEDIQHDKSLCST